MESADLTETLCVKNVKTCSLLATEFNFPFSLIEIVQPI